MHPLKLVCLLSWLLLCAMQLSLLWPALDIAYYWVLAALLPLLIPARGLWRDHHYTYKWIGFLTLIYFCIGISEWFANPDLQIYALGTTFASTLLFLASIYYARLLGLQKRD